MEIRKAIMEEQDAIMHIYHDVIADMHSKGMYQWNDQYPNRELLIIDINDEEVYVLVDEGQLIGAIVLNEYQDEEWETAEWKYTEGRTLVIHRLAIHPTAQGKGNAKQLLRFAETFAREHGYRQIRLDTYSGNPIAVRLYESIGYEHCGQVYFDKKLPFFCMEKFMGEK